MHQIDDKPAKFGYVGLSHHIGLLKSLAIGLFIVFITPFIYANSAHATQTVPYKINFQGRLTDSTGNIKPNGVYSMKFRLFSASSGGSSLWSETRDHTSGQQVTVANGLFSVQLGDVSALTASLFASGTYPLYLEVELPTPATATCTSNGCETWTEGAMSPRSPFGSSGYAFNADTVDGVDSTQLARNDASNTFTGNSQIFKNGTDSTSAFQIQNAGGANLLTADTTNSKLIVTSGSSDATIGAELVTSQNFTSANWTTCNGGVGGWTGTSTTATHNTGNTIACGATSSNFTVTAGATYQISFTVAGNTTLSNTVLPNIGGVPADSGGLGANTTHTVVITATTTGALSFTPTTNFNGAISAISVKRITNANTVLQVNNSSGVATLEVRSSGSSSNVFIGLNSGRNNTSSGINNTALGTDALQGNTIGQFNTAVGNYALGDNTIGSNNTANGYAALASNTIGSNNTANGYGALAGNTTGTSNTASGYGALFTNTTGSGNTANGQSALQNNTTGFGNTANGQNALFSNSTGGGNTSIGYQTLLNNTTGKNNTALGYYAGYNDPNASTFITLSNLQNATTIGYGAQVQQSNSLILGGVGTIAANLTPNIGIGTTSPDSLFSISPNIYDTGAASTAASATVVGVGTTWTSNMIGMDFIFASGNKYTITGFTDATHMTLSSSSTNTSQAYRIHNQAFYVTNTGATGIRASTNSSTAFQIQNASGAQVLNVDTSGNNIQIGNTTLASGTQTITLGTNNTAGSTTNLTIGSGSSATAGTTAIQSKGSTTISTNGTTRATFDNAGNLTLNTDNTLNGTTTHNGVAVFNNVNYFNDITSFSEDTVYSSYAYANFNQAFNGTGYSVQDAGTSARLLNEPDTGFQLKVSSYKAAGSDTTFADQTLLTGYASNDNLAGLVDSGITYGANLLANPGFELGCSGWTGPCAVANTAPNSGLSNLTLSTVVHAPAINIDIANRKAAVQPGDQLYASVRIKASNANAGGGGMYVEYLDASGAHLSYDNADFSNPGTSYITKSWVFTVPAGAAYAKLDLTARGDGTAPATWSFDDVVLKAVYSIGPAVFRSEVNSSSAFQVQDSGGNSILGVDTNGARTLMNANNSTTLSTLAIAQAGGGDAALSVNNATNNYNLGLDATDNKFKLGTYAGTSVAGIKTYSNNMDSGNANTILAELVQATSTGTVSKVSLHYGPDATGTAQAAIYSDNGSRTAPLTKLASSSSATPTANSWVDFTLTGVSVTAGQYYWVAYNVSSATAQQNFAYQTDGVTQKIYNAQTYNSWPSTWLAGGTNEPGLGFGMTMTITSASQTDQFATSALSLNQYGQTVFQAPANSTQAFQIQNTDGTQLFNADTVQNRVTIAKIDTDTLPTLNLFQGSAGDSALSVSTSTQGYNVGLDGSDGAFKIGTYGNSTSGVTSASGNEDSGNADFLICSAIYAKTTGAISTLHIHLGAVSGHMKMAIYTDDGTIEKPLTLLGNSASITVATANSWQAFPLVSAVSVTAGTAYWLCFNSDSSTTEQDFSEFGQGTVAGAYKPTTYSQSFPNTDPTGNASSLPHVDGSTDTTKGWAVNMDVVLSAQTDQFAISPFKMSSDGSTTFQNTADSDTAFAVRSATGQSLLSLDTARMGVTINGETDAFNNIAQRVNVLTVNAANRPIYDDNVNGIQVKYFGGNIAGEAAGMRIDYIPGDSSTNAGTWDGLRIVADPTGATSGTKSYGIKLEGPSTPGAGQDTAQYIGTGWDLGVDIQSGGLQLGGATASDPTSSVAANNLQIYAKSIAGRAMPTYRGDTSTNNKNASTPLQASLGFNRVTMMTPGYIASGCAVPASSFVAIGPAPIVTASTCVTPAPASTNMLSASRRTQLATSTSTNFVSFVYPGAQPYMWRGNAAGLGGFFYTARFGTSTTVSGNRAFVGLYANNGAPGNIDPTSDTGFGKIGVGINANTGNWKLINNIQSAAPTAPDFGSNFPVSTSNLYELVLYSAPNGTAVGYRFTNLTTGNSTSGSLTSNIPTNATFMQPYAWITNNSTASSAVLDYEGHYVESDY